MTYIHYKISFNLGVQNITNGKAARISRLAERCVVTASVTTLRGDPWNIKIHFHQFLVELGETKATDQVSKLLRTGE